MQTVLLELKNNTVINLLLELEKINLIKLIDFDRTKKQKLSNKFRASISKDKAAKLHEQLNTEREEWKRDI